MNAGSWSEGIAVRRYDSLDSTNEEARRLSQAGQKGPLWIASRSQTGGRGRRGRVWVSEPGNLYATLLVHPPGPSGRHAQLGFVAGLAAGETIATYAPGTEVLLKWPNDVLVNARKAAGILLEGLGAGGLAVGVGINLAYHPASTEFSATSLAAESGFAPDPEAALGVLAGRMRAWYEIWLEHGFAPVRDAWMARAFGLGDGIRARLANGDAHGIFEGLDDDGALVLRAPGGSLSRVTAGDVFF